MAVDCGGRISKSASVILLQYIIPRVHNREGGKIFYIIITSRGARFARPLLHMIVVF